MLCSGVWMQAELRKYLVLNGEYSDVAPYILVATGSLILLISSLACCCTVKGHPTLLYLVNWITHIVDIEHSLNVLSVFVIVVAQYGGFLGVILIIELALATSMYAYKDRLADGFDKGLTDSMIKYEADNVAIITDFDLMQGKVMSLHPFNERWAWD